MNTGEATFFDGEFAFDRQVTARLDAHSLTISGAGTAERRWPLPGLIAIERPAAGRALRLTHETAQTTRLVLQPGPFLDAVVAAAPHLRGGVTLRGTVRTVAPWAAVVAGLAAVTYLFVSVAPEKLAYVMPDSWRKNLGATTEKALTGDAKQCTNPVGTAAMAALAKRLSESGAVPPSFDIRVYNIPIVNAFALPGGRIVVTGNLIDAAKTPEEVAGVVAHELGHVHYRHAEAGAIRVFGLQALLAAFTGGNDNLTEFGALLTILRFSREAEREADTFALELMAREAIDPMGLRAFFESVKKLGAPSDGVFDRIEGMISTHPGIDERIGNIMPLPAGITPRPALSDADWQALRKICE
jgi:Zn-dependent protease with chaperone function